MKEIITVIKQRTKEKINIVDINHWTKELHLKNQVHKIWLFVSNHGYQRLLVANI